MNNASKLGSIFESQRLQERDREKVELENLGEPHATYVIPDGEGAKLLMWNTEVGVVTYRLRPNGTLDLRSQHVLDNDFLIALASCRSKPVDTRFS